MYYIHIFILRRDISIYMLFILSSSCWYSENKQKKIWNFNPKSLWKNSWDSYPVLTLFNGVERNQTWKSMWANHTVHQALVHLKDHWGQIMTCQSILQGCLLHGKSCPGTRGPVSVRHMAEVAACHGFGPLSDALKNCSSCFQIPKLWCKTNW